MRRSCLLALVLVLAAFNAAGADAPPSPPSDPARDIAACVDRAAADFGVSKLLILLILDVEGGWVGASMRNTNGTYDYGPMQINSSWLPKLARFGITADLLQHHACTNIYTGTWLLAKLSREHASIVDVIAHYHSPTRKHQIRYLGRVEQRVRARLAALAQDQAP